MPFYADLSTLPKGIKDNLPLHARVIYMNAFNNAWEEYKQPDKGSLDDSHWVIATKVAWAAVKKVYEKDEKIGLWKRKKSKVAA
jgi:cation transport regulator